MQETQQIQTREVREAEDFRRLAREQLPRLYAIARALVGEDAEDAVQDCLLKAFQGYGQLHDTAAGPAWLRKILVNRCRDLGRTRARQPVQVDLDQAENFSLYRKIAYEDPFPYSDSLHLDFLAGFGNEDVRAVLTSLPELYRVPLVLVHMEGFLAREVAAVLDAPLGTVLARLHRGRKLFELRLWEYAEENGLLKEGASR
ncbi:sigma-70 family RNA polymerase sigma factor [Streptomyces sp. CC208A]|uniref:sigma-70 family RNA polymerase sigma factor n=1 Tax=Streptomyces sp. CC208A TaxID=3044573 RepID=UPI0024A9D76B|nr:sigma-70 family RNA polymerase sigma factor [Streptomyces sp. CC208A]